MVIYPLVPEKKIFEGFTIYVHGGHFEDVTSIMFIIFYLSISESLHIKFDLKWPSGFLEKKKSPVKDKI